MLAKVGIWTLNVSVQRNRIKPQNDQPLSNLFVKIC